MSIEGPPEQEPGFPFPLPSHAKQWEELAPGTAMRLLAEAELESKHHRRIELLEMGSRYFGQVCAMSTVVILAILSSHFASSGAPTQGATIVGTAALGIVTVFITGRLVRRR